MPAQPAWATPRNVALLIAAYLIVHFCVRLWIGSALGVDDAEQALFAQHWLASYRLRAPPLFTWALLALSPMTGVGAVVISVLRYVLLAMIFGFVYLTARRLVRDPSLAALATFSFAAIYVFGYYSHHDLTHTTVLSAFLAASWYAFVRLCETPSLRWYLALGLCFGLGTLGKWNFVIFALALPLACLLNPAYRSLVLSWKIVPAALLAAAIALPSAYWAYSIGPSAGDAMGDVLGDRNSGLLTALVKGTASLIVAIVAYPEPFLVIFLVAFGGVAWRGFMAPAAALPQATQPIPDSALVGSVVAISLALHWLLVPLAGATEFQERLLQPALLILPVYLFMLVERGLGAQGVAPARAVRGFAYAVATVAGIALVARVGVHAAGVDYCRKACRDMIPAAAVADGLRSAGFVGNGTIVVRDVHLGGNLRVQFPEARVMTIGYPPRFWPAPSGAGQCLAVWSDPVDVSRSQIAAYLGGELRVPATAQAREGEVSVPYRGSQRAYRVFYSIYDTPQGDCR